MTHANRPPSLGRRAVLAAGTALPLFSIRTRPADAADFTYKLATGQDPTHPVNKRSQEAIDRIREATGGRLEIRLFPANQLGSDTDLLGQVRNGGVEFFNQAASILATLVPAAGIVNVGFAFTSQDQVWRAMDGALGTYIQSQIEKAGLLTASPIWANGFREITSSTKAIHTPDDLQGFKNPCSCRPDPDVAVSGARCRTDADQLQRAVFGLADQAGRGAGEPPADHLHG